jgi:hypothetical protein
LKRVDTAPQRPLRLLHTASKQFAILCKVRASAPADGGQVPKPAGPFAGSDHRKEAGRDETATP